jgi:hypothetical protein
MTENRVNSFITRIVTGHVFEESLRASIYFPRRKTLANDGSIFKVEVDQLATADIEYALKRTPLGIYDMYKGDKRRLISSIVNHVQDIEHEIVSKLPELHITDQGAEILTIKVKDRVVTGESRVGLVDLRAFDSELEKRTISRQKKLLSMVTVAVIGWAGWQFQAAIKNIKSLTEYYRNNVK